jgi:hypothetical protein
MAKENRKVPFNMRVSPEVKLAMAETAALENRTLTGFIENLLIEYIESQNAAEETLH